MGPTETTFTDDMKRFDEEVLGFEIDHTEGNIPSATIEVRNPHIGLLAPGRQVYAWLAFDDGTSVDQTFLGRLVGIPKNMIGETVSLEFTGRPDDYIRQKQLVAETLKYLPNYDPIFFVPKKRDDPDAILEGHSVLYHVGRTDQTVSVSDVLVGEDGLEIFEPADVPRDSVSVGLNEPPLAAVVVDAKVSWTQAATGYLDMGFNSLESYAGDGLMSDWAKPGEQLGGGWVVSDGLAVDAAGIECATTVNLSANWTNGEETHANGDAMSYSMSQTLLVGTQGGVSGIVSSKSTSGVVDPYATDDNGDPAPINIPMSVSYSHMLVPLWQVNTAMLLKYLASRKRTERVSLTLAADVQAVITNPLIQQNTESITLGGSNVDEPVINLLNWDSISGQEVAEGQVIFPDNPAVPGQVSCQIASTPGTAGLVEPDFSNVAGQDTIDNTVTWTSMGETDPTSAMPDWTRNTMMAKGEMILPRVPDWTLWMVLAQAGLLAWPPTGTSISLYQVIRGSNGYFFCCVMAGMAGFSEPIWTAVVGTTVIDGTAWWRCIGPSVPTGYIYYICTQYGKTGEVLPNFTFNIGDTITDGSVIWTCVGIAELPIGGYPGNTPRSSYFPTDRGLSSIEHLMCRARAKLRFRSRMVKVSFDVPFQRALALSCRKNAQVQDPRLPGGQAQGKIIAYKIIAKGDTGRLYGNVTIGCAVGTGDSITVSDGTESYVATGYTNLGYQYMDGQVLSVSTAADMTYQPPVSAVTDDGLSFPLTKDQVVQDEGMRGSLSDQAAAAMSYLFYCKVVQDLAQGTAAQQLASSAISAINGLGTLLKQHPVWYTLQLAPLDNGPFQDQYVITTGNLVLPMTIDLAAPSTP